MDSIIVKGLSALPGAAQKVIDLISDRNVVALYGSMGVGKTTLIREICDQMGVQERVSSPSFAIVNVYNRENGEQINHFDFYRIKKIEEAYDFGYEEYFFSGNLCLIEWPELVEELLPQDCLRLSIEEVDEDTRIINVI